MLFSSTSQKWIFVPWLTPWSVSASNWNRSLPPSFIVWSILFVMSSYDQIRLHLDLKLQVLSVIKSRQFCLFYVLLRWELNQSLIVGGFETSLSCQYGPMCTRSKVHKSAVILACLKLRVSDLRMGCLPHLAWGLTLCLVPYHFPAKVIETLCNFRKCVSRCVWLFLLSEKPQHYNILHTLARTFCTFSMADLKEFVKLRTQWFSIGDSKGH